MLPDPHMPTSTGRRGMVGSGGGKGACPPPTFLSFFPFLGGAFLVIYTVNVSASIGGPFRAFS